MAILCIVRLSYTNTYSKNFVDQFQVFVQYADHVPANAARMVSMVSFCKNAK